MQKVGEAGTRAHSKVTIVGVGQVGMACAYSIMQQVIRPKHQAHSKGLYSPAPGEGKNRHWKRACQTKTLPFALYSFLGLPCPPSLLCFLFLVSCVLCPVSCVLCPVSCVLCRVSCVLFLVSCVLCPVFCVMCPVSCVLCLVSCVLCPVSCVLCPVSCSLFPVSCFVLISIT